MRNANATSCRSPIFRTVDLSSPPLPFPPFLFPSSSPLYPSIQPSPPPPPSSDTQEQSRQVIAASVAFSPPPAPPDHTVQPSREGGPDTEQKTPHRRARDPATDSSGEGRHVKKKQKEKELAGVWADFVRLPLEELPVREVCDRVGQLFEGRWESSQGGDVQQ